MTYFIIYIVVSVTLSLLIYFVTADWPWITKRDKHQARLADKRLKQKLNL